MNNRKKFTEYLSENGFPFLNVFNGEYETLFGNKTEDLEDKDDQMDDDTKTKRKLYTYLRYATNINEEKENNGQ